MTTDPVATAARAERALQSTVAAPPHPGPPARPDTVPVVQADGYKLLDVLGSGACGIVYKARHEKLGRDVALKTVLVADRAPEARALAKLQHPHIVTVFDTGACVRPAGFAYIAMELLGGETLDAALAREPLAELPAWFAAHQAAGALAHALDKGFVHRDVKPANLFLVPVPEGIPFPDGAQYVKVTDFGLALENGVGIGTGDDARGGVAVGTPVYMAPEQFAGGAVDHRADIYALGATLFHARTGKVPFDGRSAAEVAQQKALELQALPNGSPEEVALLKWMMARDPADRPQTYKELLGAIEALPFFPLPGGSGRYEVCPVPVPVPYVVQVPVPPACPPAPPCLRTRALQAAALLAAGLILGVGAALLAGAVGGK
jgi:serine/threonine protein kinase